MKQTKKGDKVKVHYTGRLENGQVFGSTTDDEPLEFTLGKGKFIKCFEDAVIGMYEGQKKLVKIPSEEACGPYKDELVLCVDKTKIPLNIDPNEGFILNLKKPNGKVLIKATVTEVSDDSIALDLNHPLAGKNLTFNIELMEIVQEESS